MSESFPGETGETLFGEGKTAKQSLLEVARFREHRPVVVDGEWGGGKRGMGLENCEKGGVVDEEWGWWMGNGG